MGLFFVVQPVAELTDPFFEALHALIQFLLTGLFIEFGHILAEDLSVLTKEIEVFNHVSVRTNHHVNGVNGYETFDHDIAKDNMRVGPQPEAVTQRVAELMRT